MDAKTKQEMLKREYQLRLEAEEKEREEARKNSGFFMMFDGEAAAAFRRLISTSQVAANTFVVLAENMDRLGAVLIANTTLAAMLGIHPVQVSRALSVLREMGLIFTLKTGGGNLHGINPEIVWRSSETSKRFAFFHSRVYVEADEMEDAIEKLHSNRARAAEAQKTKIRSVRGKVLVPKQQRDLPPPVGPTVTEVSEVLPPKDPTA